MIEIKNNSKSGIYSSDNAFVEIKNAEIKNNGEHGID